MINSKRFLNTIQINGEDDCWPWLGSIDYWGYGRYSHQKAHRLSYIIHKGEIPEGIVVRHTCDNKICVNPKHLILGTQFDNMKDAVERKRTWHPHKTWNPKAKLTEELVAEIRNSDRTYKQLAKDYDVSVSTIYHVRNFITWKDDDAKLSEILKND